jgi:MFS superfamily sulfate permease-like transporter
VIAFLSFNLILCQISFIWFPDIQLRPNQEVLSLGIGCLVGSVFQSYPICGSLSRSTVLSESGAKTNVANSIQA